MKAEKKFFAWPIQQKERPAALKAGYRPGHRGSSGQPIALFFSFR